MTTAFPQAAVDSAVLLDAAVVAVDELDVGEGEVADLAVELALPLAVDGHLGDLDDVADVEAQRGLVVRVRDARLLHARVRGELALEGEDGFLTETPKPE